MGCDCGKPKCDGHCGVSPAVLQINNPSECVLFHRVEVPASMGDSKTNPPKSGAYKNMLLYYEADQTSWLYSSDGVPQKLVNGVTNYEDAINLPQINGVTLLGNKSLGDLGIASSDEVAIVFDTVADMKQATNLVDGSYAQTLGYHAKGDSGASLYKIRTNTNDVIDEAKIIALADDTLIAELIVNTFVTPEQFGCYGDNTHDDTVNLQKALDSGFEVHTSKQYLISDTVNVNYSLIMQSDSFIHFTPAVTGLGVGVAHTLGRQMINKTYKINVDAHGHSDVAVGFGMPKKCNIDVYVDNAGTTGVQTNYYSDNGNNENIFNFHINGNASGTTVNGVYYNTYDSTVKDIITRDCKYGVYLNHGELIVNQIHCWLSNSTVAALWGESSCVHTGGAYHATIGWLYQDSIKYGLDGNGISGTIDYFEYNNGYDTSVYTGMVNVYFPDITILLLIKQFTNDVDKYNLITYDNHNAYKNSIFGVNGLNGPSAYYQQAYYHDQFTDCDLAPQICSKYCKYTVTNLPTSTNGVLSSEIVGNMVKQTFAPSNIATNVRFWVRYRTFNSTTWGDWSEYRPYTAP